MNMTAPPGQVPIFTPPSYLSPTSSAPDLANPWAPMPPNQFNAQQQHPRKSSTPPAKDSSSNGLLFITGNKPADFKARSVMTKVRKKAMGSYLEKEKKPGLRPRLQSEDSTGSHTSTASDHQPEGDHVTSNEDVLRMYRRHSKRSKKQSSPPEPSTSSNHPSHQVPTPELSLSRVPTTLDFLLPSAPMVQPPRTGVPLPFNQTLPRPFQSLGKSWDPFGTMYQAQDPRISVEELKFYCSRFFGTRAMGRYWIPTLVKSPHAFLSTLCIASTHYDAVHSRQVESIRTTALRQEVIHLISQNILDPQAKTDDFNIIALTQLIVSEIIAGDDTALSFHENGVEAMINSRGGLKQLGVNGRLASTLSWVSLESAILREASPRSNIYSDFCASTSFRNYPNTATIPESPLFCPHPRVDFQTIKRSPRCAPRALDLLKEIRTMMDLFLQETKHSRQNPQSLGNIYKRIVDFPSAFDLQKNTILNHSDWTYEAIRIAAVIQATAIIKRIPLSEALKHAALTENPMSIYTSSAGSKSNESLVSPTNFRHDSPVTAFSTTPSYATSPVYNQSNPFNFAPRPSVSSIASDITFFPPPAAPTPTGPGAVLANLKAAIENSDMSDCWDDMAGVLFWISLVSGAASRRSDRVVKKWFSALAVRCSIILCFDHPEPVHSSILRMGEMVESLGAGAKGEEVARKESASKKRRV